MNNSHKRIMKELEEERFRRDRYRLILTIKKIGFYLFILGSASLFLTYSL